MEQEPGEQQLPEKKTNEPIDQMRFNKQLWANTALRQAIVSWFERHSEEVQDPEKEAKYQAVSEKMEKEREAIIEEMDAAVDFAEESPQPAPEHRFKHNIIETEEGEVQ